MRLVIALNPVKQLIALPVRCGTPIPTWKVALAGTQLVSTNQGHSVNKVTDMSAFKFATIDPYYLEMTMYTIPTESTILLGVVGSVGVIASLVTVLFAFRRNRAHKY